MVQGVPIYLISAITNTLIRVMYLSQQLIAPLFQSYPDMAQPATLFRSHNSMICLLQLINHTQFPLIFLIQTPSNNLRC